MSKKVKKVKDFSKERKELQSKGLAPHFMTTQGYQLFFEKYLNGDSKNPKDQYMRIAKVLAQYAPKVFPKWWNEIDYWKGKTWEQAFFDIMWDGFLSPSTPLLTNTGTNYGQSISCSGAYVGNSVYEFYETRKSNALLSKEGFGTSVYIGDVQARGTPMKNGTANGAQVVAKMFVSDSMDISQGQQRRGAQAWYYPVEGGDFYELAHYLETETDGNNAGWCFTDSFKQKLLDKNMDAIKRWGTVLSTKTSVGLGYHFFVDKANRLRPQAYINKDLYVKASQLCTEITLFSDEEHTYTCVLSSENLKYWNKRPDMLAFVGTVFLDCVVSDFIIKGSKIKGIERAIRFTEKSRALGYGVMGFHTYLMDNKMEFGGLQSKIANRKIFKKINDEQIKASKWLAKLFGEPEWCEGTGMRHTHLSAIAPTKSSSLILGGVSEGINPQVAMVFKQKTPAGEVDRVDPSFFAFLLEKGLYVSEDDKATKALLADISSHKGSIQHRPEFTDEEKLLFRTAFEINPYDHLDMTDARQPYVSQSQSCNLFVANMSGKDISKLYWYAYNLPNLISLYYHTGLRDAGIKTSFECLACQ